MDPDRRLELQVILEEILGTRQVYFQPPPSVVMQYPAIVYMRDDLDTQFADGRPYALKTRYQVTVIDSNPDSVIHHAIAQLPFSSYVRFYAADQLNHDVYNLFY